MARLIGAMLSLHASGTIAKTLTASTWKGIQYGRVRVKPANHKTVAQVAFRGVFADAVVAYQDLTAPEMLAWYNLVAGQGLSGFNKFVAAYIALNYVAKAKVTPAVIPPQPGE